MCLARISPKSTFPYKDLDSCASVAKGATIRTITSMINFFIMIGFLNLVKMGVKKIPNKGDS
jgi:hypothetical protein